MLSVIMVMTCFSHRISVILFNHHTVLPPIYIFLHSFCLFASVISFWFCWEIVSCVKFAHCLFIDSLNSNGLLAKACIVFPKNAVI